MPVNHVIGDTLQVTVSSFMYTGPAGIVYVAPVVLQNNIPVYSTQPYPVNVPAATSPAQVAVAHQFTMTWINSAQLAAGAADVRIDVSASSAMTSPIAQFAFGGVYAFTSPQQVNYTPSSFTAAVNVVNNVPMVAFAWQRAAGQPSGSIEILDLATDAAFSNPSQISPATLGPSVNGNVVQTTVGIPLNPSVTYYARVRVVVNNQTYVSNVATFTTPAAQQQPPATPTITNLIATFS